MPDWSYRTILRPMLLALGEARAQRLAVGTLRALGRLPLGLRAIDFLGHMRADPRLRTRAGSIELAGPVALGAYVDPRGEALAAFARFGVGLIEVVADDPRRLEACDVPVAVRIPKQDADAGVRRIVSQFERRAALFIVDRENVDAAITDRPVLSAEVMHEHADGVWMRGDTDRVRAMRAALPPDAILVASGASEPEDARAWLDAGANVVAVDEGLVTSGPGLVKRCNEALLSLHEPSTPEPMSFDAARRSWFWAFWMGVAMFAGGVMAVAIASTRVVLPYDESLCGLTRAQMIAINPRLLPFMAHDRVSLAGTMLSVGIFYAALGWFGIRRGAHWAQVTVVVSALTGFLSFFSFLGFGYFDPFHAFVTAVLTQFMLLCMVMQPSPPGAPAAEWRETAAWRRGQWGQLLFILIGVGLTGAGFVITIIGCTEVFVPSDLAFMRSTAAQLRISYEHLVPLVAHDRASLGGMLIANGVTVWLAAQWGFRAGVRWLWTAFAWGGNAAFLCAVSVHFVVGYDEPLHLAPAILGWVMWNAALTLTYEWSAGAMPAAAEVPRRSAFAGR